MPLIKSQYNEMSSNQLVDLYNSLVSKDKKIKKFSDRATALRRISQLQKQPQKEEKELPMKTPEIKSKLIRSILDKRPAAIRAKKAARVITKLVQENPRRKDSKGFHAFNLYKEGMTIAEYLAAGGELVHLRWDIKYKFVSLSE